MEGPGGDGRLPLEALVGLGVVKLLVEMVVLVVVLIAVLLLVLLIVVVVQVEHGIAPARSIVVERHCGRGEQASRRRAKLRGRAVLYEASRRHRSFVRPW